MPDVIIFILLIIGAYLLGSVPLAYFIGKWVKGIDLREYGSGNVGMTNLVASTSVWWGIPVLIFDLGKGAIGVLAARWLGLPLWMQSIVGMAAILGHNWPVFLKFNAGRGVLTTVGTALAVEPIITAILTLLSFTGIPFHQLPITALFCIFMLPVTFWFSTAPVLKPLFTYPLGDERLAVTLVFLVIFLLVPIRRMTVPLSEVSKTISKRELMVNRFIFDRDIRNREEWLRRAPTKARKNNRDEAK